MNWLFNQSLSYAGSLLQSIGWGTIAVIVGILLFTIAVISYMTHVMRKIMPFVIAFGILFIACGGLSLIKVPEVPKPKPWSLTLPELPKITLPKLPTLSKEDVRKITDFIWQSGETAVQTAKDVITDSLAFLNEHVIQPAVEWFQTPIIDYEALAREERKRQAEYERRRTIELARIHRAELRAQNDQARMLIDQIIAEGTDRAVRQYQLEQQEMMRRYYQLINPRMPGR
jgi:hypothetical protein